MHEGQTFGSTCKLAIYMAVNKYNFRWMYLQNFRTAVDYFAKILSEKVIPGFEGLPEEADALAQEVYKKLGMSFDPDHDDPADSAKLHRMPEFPST
jgi:hypothetical protein